jgi:hypothetical protein
MQRFEDEPPAGPPQTPSRQSQGCEQALPGIPGEPATGRHKPAFVSQLIFPTQSFWLLQEVVQ